MPPYRVTGYCCAGNDCVVDGGGNHAADVTQQAARQHAHCDRQPQPAKDTPTRAHESEYSDQHACHQIRADQLRVAVLTGHRAQVN